VDAGAGVLAYRFNSASSKEPAREVIALWNPKDAGRVELKVSARPVKIINAVGEVKELPGGAPPGNKALRIVTVDLQPGAAVYVESALSR
jgi:hypothetical protein